MDRDPKTPTIFPLSSSDTLQIAASVVGNDRELFNENMTDQLRLMAFNNPHLQANIYMEAAFMSTSPEAYYHGATFTYLTLQKYLKKYNIPMPTISHATLVEGTQELLKILEENNDDLDVVVPKLQFRMEDREPAMTDLFWSFGEAYGKENQPAFFLAFYQVYQFTTKQLERDANGGQVK